MGIVGRREAEQSLQMDLTRCIVQKVRAPHHVRHPLRGIIDHDGQYIGEQLIAASNQDIADGGCDILAEDSLNAVLELNDGLVDANARRTRRTGPQRTVAAMAWIALIFSRSQTAARALKGQSARMQTVERGRISIGTFALAHHLAIPFEAEPVQGPKYSVGGPRNHPGRVKILDA